MRKHTCFGRLGCLIECIYIYIYSTVFSIFLVLWMCWAFFDICSWVSMEEREGVGDVFFAFDLDIHMFV